jgi:hypothetical protein
MLREVVVYVAYYHTEDRSVKAKVLAAVPSPEVGSSLLKTLAKLRGWIVYDLGRYIEDHG